MIQIDERFNMVNLEYLENSEELALMGSGFLKNLIEGAIKEIKMHRKFNKDYNDYLKVVNGHRVQI